MPRTGMEPVRRRALIDAAVSAIGERGSLDVTMSEIAGRAGVSSALAHHYFGGKDDLLKATMRHLLRELAVESAVALSRAKTPRERISAVVEVSFSPTQFASDIVAAWLAFYVAAQHSQDLRRLLRVYARRLHTNLMSGFAPLLEPAEADRAAEGVAALIDGLYIRRALNEGQPNPVSAIALIEDYVALKVGSDR